MIMRVIIILTVVSIALLSGCKNSDRYKEKLNSLKEKDLELSIKNVTINTIDTIGESDFMTLKYNELYNSYYLYNSLENTIELFNENSSQNTKIKLRNLDKYGEVYDVFILNLDTIFLCQTNQLSIIDTASAIKKYWKINQDENAPFFIGKFSDGMPIYYDNINRCIYLERFNIDCSKNHCNCMGYSPELKINIDNAQIDTIHFVGSNIFQWNFGDMYFPSRCANSKVHVFSYTPDPNLYIYDVKSNTTKVVGGKSKHHKTSYINDATLTSGNLDFNKKLEQLIVLPQYTTIQYNKNTNKYYRLFLSETPYTNNQGLYNTYRDKKCYLMIFDDDFNINSEIEIENKYSVSYMMNTHNGIGLIYKVEPKKIELNYVSFK